MIALEPAIIQFASQLVKRRAVMRQRSSQIVNHVNAYDTVVHMPAPWEEMQNAADLPTAMKGRG
jgi:hypothetical protein